MSGWQLGDLLYASVACTRELFELIPDVDCYPQPDGSCRSGIEARWPGEPWPEDEIARAVLAAKVGWWNL